mmetsp:Transcript_4672/g.29495  ORF Transcript_4672/g.29495 Transcript_4672/m.29495 type:complete len:98 (-) Transcript_4672:2385-2678(-)
MCLEAIRMDEETGCGSRVVKWMKQRGSRESARMSRKTITSVTNCTVRFNGGWTMGHLQKATEGIEETGASEHDVDLSQRQFSVAVSFEASIADSLAF